MIDAYDALGVGLEAEGDEIKKAFHRMSLQNHPDKVSPARKEAANVRFNEIKLARDILSDPDRRKIYDTFGIDLGEEPPEMEVWSIGISTLLAPIGSFVVKTAIARAAVWFIGFRWIGRILAFIGVAVAGLYAIDFRYHNIHIRSPDFTHILIYILLVDACILLYWFWPLLADGVVVFYLFSEIVGLPVFVESWKIGVAAALASLVVARLAIGRWWWILGTEAALAVLLLASLTAAVGIMRLWIDGVQAQKSEALREWRMGMRKQRKALEDEVAELKQKLLEKGGGPVVNEATKRPAR